MYERPCQECLEFAAHEFTRISFRGHLAPLAEVPVLWPLPKEVERRACTGRKYQNVYVSDAVTD